jgi:hypothetical protein
MRVRDDAAAVTRPPIINDRLLNIVFAPRGKASEGQYDERPTPAKAGFTAL